MDDKDKRISGKKFVSTSGPKTQGRPPKLKDCKDVDEDEDDMEIPEGDVKKKPMSIFAQRMAAKKREAEKGNASKRLMGKLEVQKTVTTEGNGSLPMEVDEQERMQLEEIKKCLQSLGVVDNAQTVTPNDVLQLREQVLKSVTPKSLGFLVNRKPNQDIKKIGEKNGKGQDKEELQGLPFPVDELKKYPNMDIIEQPKLEWMKEAQGKPEKEKTKDPGEIQARFDLEGKVMSLKITSDDTWWQALHHHGEEMDRPGYTFEEYLHYARSSNPSQRAFAMTAMAAVFSKAHDGLYDEVLSVSPLELIANVDVMSTLRVALDFEDMVTLDAAVACLAALLFPESEEECYDVIHLFPDPKPYLWHKILDSEKGISAADPKIRDHQVLVFDLISFLIERSHLIERIKYLFYQRKERISKSAEINMLKILIRLARHSPDEVTRHEDILYHICENLMDANWMKLCESPMCKNSKNPEIANCNPNAISTWMATKLCRVLIQSSYKNACVIHEKLHVMDNVVTYLVSSTAGIAWPCSHGRLLLLECFRFWSSSIEMGLAVSQFGMLSGAWFTVFKNLSDCKITKYDGYFAAYLIHLLNTILQCGARQDSSFKNFESAWAMVKSFDIGVLTLTMNTWEILKTAIEDWHIAVITQGMKYLEIAFKHGKMVEYKSSVAKYVEKSDLQAAFKPITAHSILLGPNSIKNPYPSNFVSSNHVQAPGRAISIVAPLSPFQMLKPCIDFHKIFGATDKCLTEHVVNYVMKLAEKYPLFYPNSFYYKFEKHALFSLLNIIPLQPFVKTILIHFVCTLSRTDSSLFQAVIEKLASMVMLGKEVEHTVNLYLACYFPNTTPEDYGSDSSEFSEDIIQHKPVLFTGLPCKLVRGKFWMLDPLQRLCDRYVTKRNDLKAYSKLVAAETRACLSFAEKMFSETSVYSSGHDLVTSYILVSQVFLMGEDLVGEEGVTDGLRRILKKMVECWQVIGTDKKQFSEFKPGPDTAFMSSFEEYYRDLVKEFESTSFGNDVFAAYLLLPQRLAESTELKQIFWSMQGTRFVRLPLQNDMLPFKYFTNKTETNPAILKLQAALLYGKTSISEANNPFLYHILKETVLNSSFRINEETK